MNYAELNAIFLVVAAGVLVLAIVRRPKTAGLWPALGAALAALLILTAIFDNVMIASGLFDYSGHALAGQRIGLAPLEDFAYPLAAALLLPGLWLLFTPGRRT